jgi:hypothetical protein
VPSCVSRPSRAFRFNSFLLDAAAPPSFLAQPLRPQHSRLVVRPLSHSLYPLPSNSARTRPFVLTTSPSRAPLSVSKRRRTLRPAAASGHLPPPSVDSTPHILRKSPHDRGRGALCACYSHDETVSNVLHTAHQAIQYLTCRLSTHAPADRAGHPTSHEKPRPLRPPKGRKAPNCQPNPRRARRALCCAFLTASPL